jgi:riboflavin biosynthesis pyrimidine reductase
VADEVKICGETAIDFALALEWLHDRWNVKRLLCEGGGEVNAGLFREKLVDEVYMTLAPLIFGGRGAPTVVDGEGIADVDEATRLRLRSCQRVGNELFLIYRVDKPGRAVASA